MGEASGGKCRSVAVQAHASLSTLVAENHFGFLQAKGEAVVHCVEEVGEPKSSFSVFRPPTAGPQEFVCAWPSDEQLIWRRVIKSHRRSIDVRIFVPIG